VNNKNRHHIIETIDQLFHDDLHNVWGKFPLSYFHELFKITSITKLHENVISSISFNSLSHFDHVLALDAILILYLGNNQGLLC